MLLSYRILFSIELLHEYFNKDIFSDCSILQATETKGFFGSENLQRFFINRLFVLAQDTSGKPHSPIDPDRVYRFYLKCNKADFFNYTNIDQRVGTGSFLYF